MALLEGLLRYLELLGLTLWVGGIAFFSFIASPSIFSVLGLEGGGKVVRDIFPKYYLLGYGSGGAATVAAILLTLLGARGQGLMALLLAIMTGIFLYMGRILRPQILKVRAEVGSLEAPASDSGPRERFERLHRRSVRLNACVLVLGLVTLFLFAWHR
ncbi:MAG: DUF4149 domain-containing protein [Candidatus Methylomirabilales bacterium]